MRTQFAIKGFRWWTLCLLIWGLASASCPAGEIHVAIHEARFDDALKLLREDASLIKEKDHQYNKPLHLAALKGATNLVSYLIAHGADVNSRNKFGQTPLHRAMIGGDYVTTKLLIDAHAEVNGRDNQGVIPVHVAAQRRHGKLVELLLEHGAEVDAQDAFRRRPINMSIMGSSNESLQALVKAGADYNFIDAHGNNFLHLAAGGGSPALVTTFLELKLGVNSVNSNKFTAAHFAAQNGHKEVLEVLDKWGGDFNLRSSNKRTPLDMVKAIRDPFRLSRHDEVQVYLEKWHAEHKSATATASPKSTAKP
jgi:ankyrin repeat protein